MFRAIILPIFRSTRLCVTACGIMHPRCCQPATDIKHHLACSTQSRKRGHASIFSQGHYFRDIRMQPVFSSGNAGETVACMHFVFLPNHFTFQHRLQANYLLRSGATCWLRTGRRACLTELALLWDGRKCICDRHPAQAFMRNSTVKRST